MIYEKMAWPPMGINEWKMKEHAAWYSGSPELLANFYYDYDFKNIYGLQYSFNRLASFWSRQIGSDATIFTHVPLAGDIAAISSNFLFAEQPQIKITEAQGANASSNFKTTQDELETMLEQSTFEHRKLLEGAECAAAIGGVYLKLAWDEELSDYPIPMIVQPDDAIPEFKFGYLTKVTFWKEYPAGDKETNKVYRLLEEYIKGYINYKLFLGTNDNLGVQVSLTDLKITEEYKDSIETGIDEILAVYVPNMTPNRLVRNSCMGRSDYLGVESLLENLDETFTCWMREIVLAQPKVIIPESFMQKNSDGEFKYDVDKNMYVSLDIDPLTQDNKITLQQFEIRADQFEKTILNIMERVITTAGFSPQSFGLNISGRAESGTALHLRERKSFATKDKKGGFWEPAINKFVHLMIRLKNAQLGGKMEENVTINTSLSDGVTNDMNVLSSSVKMLSDAMSASTETRVRILHPDWNDDQVKIEVALIQKENSIGEVANPDTTNPFKTDNGDDE